MTQLEKIRNYLEAGRTLTAPEARSRFGIKNLSARIYDLRTQGLVIGTETYVRKNGASAVKYVLRTTGKKARKS